MSNALHMPVEECMERHTYRQYEAWCEHRRMRMDEPDQVCWYLMQIAYHIHAQNSKTPGRVRDYTLLFNEPKLTEEQKRAHVAFSKGRTLNAFGGAVIHRTMPASEALTW